MGKDQFNQDVNPKGVKLLNIEHSLFTLKSFWCFWNFVFSTNNTIVLLQPDRGFIKGLLRFSELAKEGFVDPSDFSRQTHLASDWLQGTNHGEDVRLI